MSDVLHFFPDWTSGNPFQTMLHAGLADLGAEAVPVRRLVPFLQEASTRPDPGVLGLHWTAPILQRAGGPFRARLLLDEFTAALTAFTDAGGRLVWTIHNVLPHDVSHRWAEVELARLLADRASLVHVLSAATLDAVAAVYDIDPAKVVVVEHSGFTGYYPDEVGRDEARARLGVEPGETALLTLGLVRPYKGIDLLLDVLDDLGPRVRLLVAGRPVEDPAVAELVERCERDPRVTAFFAHVPDDELQLWMHAADLAVLPYRGILNSGAFLLAQTFGLPVVGPRVGALRELGDRAHVRLFEPGDPASLAAEVRAAIAAVRADPMGQRASTLAANQERLPAAMAAGYAAAVAPLLGARGLSGAAGPTASG